MSDTVRNSLRWTLEVIAPEVTWPDLLDPGGIRAVRLLTTDLLDRAGAVSRARSERLPHHAEIGLTPQLGMLGLISDATRHADRLEAAALPGFAPVRRGPARLALHQAMTAALALRTAEYLDDQRSWDARRAMFWRAGVAAHWCGHAENNVDAEPRIDPAPVWAAGARLCASHWMATLGWRQHDRVVYTRGSRDQAADRWADIQFRRARRDVTGRDVTGEDVLVISGQGGRPCSAALNAEPLSWVQLCERMKREHVALPVPDTRHLPAFEYVSAMPEPAVAGVAVRTS